MTALTESEVRENPERALEKALTGTPLRLSEILPGAQWAGARHELVHTGQFVNASGQSTRVKLRPTADGDHDVIAIATVSRNPGLANDALLTIDDLVPRQSAGNRAKLIQQYWQIYQSEGLVNNAIEKYASLLSTGGSFKVQHVRKGRNKKALQTAQAILDYWCENVNAPSDSQVITADRGVRALTEVGIRTALVEGDYMGRQVWSATEVPSFGQFDMPIAMQTLSMEFMEPFEAIGPIGEAWYWKPPSTFTNLLRSPEGQAKELQRLLKQVVRGPILKELVDNGKAFMTPALLTHVRHRGNPRSLYGQSFIEAAKYGIRYYRSVVNTDLVSMESVINRLLVVMVGSSDPTSPYSKQDVALARQQLMQSFFEEPGPNMTIVWSGDDVKVESIGAQEVLLDLKERHLLGQGMIKNALGVPEALLSGTTSDGRAAGWAAFVAAAGQAEHLGGGFASAWTILGQRILLENGFTDIDIVFQYDRSQLGDKEAERNLNRQDYLAGLRSIRTMLIASGIDADAEFRQKAIEKGLDPESESTTWESVFTPPAGLPGQGAGGVQGGAPDQGGRPSGTPAKTPTNTKSPVENR